MKKLTIILIMLISLLMGNVLRAQNVGIGNTSFTPDASAGLEIRYTDKGLLIPRVALTSTSSASPITSPATSLLIYNTATAGDVTPGYYYWNGSAWVRFATGSSVINGSGTATRVAFWSGANTLSSNANLYWDNTNSRLGIGTSSPSYDLHVQRTGGASSAKIGYSSSYTDNRLYFGDGSYVYIGEYNTDDRLYLRGSSLTIDIAGSTGSSGQVLTSNGTTCSWATPSSGGVTMGCATNNYLTKRSSATTLSCSQLYDNGTNVQIGTTSLTNCKFGISYSNTDIYGIYVTMPGWAIFGDASAGEGGRGVTGSGGECGVYGYHGSQTSVLGRLGYYSNPYYYGVYAENKRTNTGTIHYGLYSSCEGSVSGGSGTDKNIAVRGRAGNHNLMNVGVFGDVGSMSKGTNNYGIYGDAVGPTNAYGVYGKAHDCGTGYGVYGVGQDYGVYGYYNSSHYGYIGSSNYGVYGRATSTNGDAGVYGYNGSGAWGALGYYTGGAVYAGYFSGNVHYTGSLTGPSDEKFKKNISDYNNALDNIMKLRPVTYEMKTEEYPFMNFDKGTQIGFIAQEMEPIFPSLVVSGAHPGENENDPFIEYKGINYIGLTPILVKAIQEQQIMIDSLKSENNNLKFEINDLKSKYESLQKRLEEIESKLYPIK